MEKLDLVKLINDKPYIRNNLKQDMRGIIVGKYLNGISVLFFNPKNTGDYAVVNIDIKDIDIEKEKLPDEFQKEILSKLDYLISKAKDYIEPVCINDYDVVELLVEDFKYSKFGIHKGDKGCVMDSNAVENYIEVDFSGIDKNGNIYGECISVKIEDLKVINNKKQ